MKSMVVLGISLGLAACSASGANTSSQGGDEITQIGLVDARITTPPLPVGDAGAPLPADAGLPVATDAGVPVPADAIVSVPADGGEIFVCDVNQDAGFSDLGAEIATDVAELSVTPDGAPTTIVYDPPTGGGGGSGAGAARLAPRQVPASPTSALNDAQVMLTAAQAKLVTANNNLQRVKQIVPAASADEVDAATARQAVASGEVAFWQSRVTFYNLMISGIALPPLQQATVIAAANAAQRAGLQARVDAAKTVLAKAKSRLARLKACVPAVSASQIDDATDAVTDAQAALDLTKNALDRAP